MTDRQEYEERLRGDLAQFAASAVITQDGPERAIEYARSRPPQYGAASRRGMRWALPLAAAVVVIVVATVTDLLVAGSGDDGPSVTPSPTAIHSVTGDPTATPSTHTSSAHVSSPTVPTTTKPGIVAPSGRWNSSRLVITANGLGAVTIGMSLTEAAHAAGVPGFKTVGDGVSVPTTWSYHPADTYLYLSHASYTATSSLPFTCVGAQLATHPTANSQVVTTPEGVRLGDPASRVRQVYGSRALFVPKPTAGGISPRAGYIVAEQNYNLVFTLNPQETQIIAIFAGIAPATPSTCTG